ncbi:MAG: PEP-CTERM sorting domain-containing protein [Planctomycetota bacterium]
MSKFLGLGTVAVALTSPVVAQPTLVGTFVGETPGGNNEFLFEVVTDNLTGSLAIEMGFQANINEEGTVSFFNGVVEGTSDTFDEATESQGFVAQFGDGTEFDIAEDTYYFDDIFDTPNPGNNPFTSTETTGFVQTPTTLFMSFGTKTDAGSPISLVRIVTPDDSISFSGIIAQAGVNNPVSGVAVIPEPTSVALAGLTGLVLAGRRRRRA